MEGLDVELGMDYVDRFSLIKLIQLRPFLLVSFEIVRAFSGFLFLARERATGK